MSKVVVEPKDIVITKTCVEVGISVVDMSFGSSATFNVILFDDEHRPIKMDRIVLDGADYAAWTNDDSYVVSYILAKYGLTAAQ